jgi:hypothetical protein
MYGSRACAVKQAIVHTASEAINARSGIELPLSIIISQEYRE